MRKLVTIKEITAIDPIPDADNMLIRLTPTHTRDSVSLIRAFSP
jgi:hypothetical protein